MFDFLQQWTVFPGAATQGKRKSLVRPGPDAELLDLPTDNGEEIVALFGAALTSTGRPHPQASRRPTLVYFYGNGMCLANTQKRFAQFRRLGVNVLIPEFVGYGMSSGKPSENGHYATAAAAYDHLLRRGDIDPAQIVPMGWSLGAAAAVDLAWRKPVAALITLSAFTRMRDMAATHLPFFPAPLIMNYHFDNRKKISQLACPLFIGHGRRDGLVPCRMSYHLADAARRCRVTHLVIDKARHEDLFRVGQDQLLPAIGAFLSNLATDAAKHPVRHARAA